MRVVYGCSRKFGVGLAGQKKVKKFNRQGKEEENTSHCNRLRKRAHSRMNGVTGGRKKEKKNICKDEKVSKGTLVNKKHYVKTPKQENWEYIEE